MKMPRPNSGESMHFLRGNCEYNLSAHKGMLLFINHAMLLTSNGFISLKIFPNDGGCKT